MHKIQEKILKLLETKNISGMTLREIGGLVGEKYPQKIKHHLTQLEKKGFIKSDSSSKNISRASLGKIKDSNLISIPIIGTANCGPATIFANENIEGYLKISRNILNKYRNIFALRASGLSMNKASVGGKSIEDGDFLIIDSEDRNARSGDVVLSIIDNMANIKKFIWDDENDQVILASQSSQDIPPIYIHADDNFIINGKVIQVIKKPKFV